MCCNTLFIHSSRPPAVFCKKLIFFQSVFLQNIKCWKISVWYGNVPVSPYPIRCFPPIFFYLIRSFSINGLTPLYRLSQFGIEMYQSRPTLYSVFLQMTQSRPTIYSILSSKCTIPCPTLYSSDVL